MASQRGTRNNGAGTDDFDSISKNALLHLLQTKGLHNGTPNSEFPQELQGRRPHLEKLLDAFIPQWLTLCCKPQTPLEPPSDPKPYKCTYCPSAWERAADWKKHLLLHERDHEQQWQCDRVWHKSESDFHKNHRKKCAACEEWTSQKCWERRGQWGQWGQCPCSRCQHARLAFYSMEVRHACGFCFENRVFHTWDKYCSHLREHFEKNRTPVSEWSLSRVIYALIYNNDALSKAFGTIKSEGPHPQDWKSNKKTEDLRQTLRHDLQSYNDADDRALELTKRARRLVKRPDEPKILPKPGSSTSSVRNGGFELASMHTAGQPRGRISSPKAPETDNKMDVNNLPDSFIGAPDEVAWVEAEWMAIVVNSPDLVDALQGALPSDQLNSLVTDYRSFDMSVAGFIPGQGRIDAEMTEG